LPGKEERLKPLLSIQWETGSIAMLLVAFHYNPDSSG